MIKKRHIYLKYDIPYEKLESLDYIISKASGFEELRKILNSERINYKISLSQQGHRIGYLLTLDSLGEEERVKNILKKIFDKVGTPNHVYGQFKLVESVLLEYNKRFKWGFFGTKEVT